MIQSADNRSTAFGIRHRAGKDLGRSQKCKQSVPTFRRNALRSLRALFPRLHRATRELGLADASLLFVHNVQGNLAVNRLLGWRRGPEFAYAQELLSAYSEGACGRYRLVTIPVVDLDCGLLTSLARDRAETGPCRIGAMATKNVARRRRRHCLRWGRARWRFGTVCFDGFAGR